MTHPIYQRNNILFRIASSAAISKFKKAQAEVFIQASRREINLEDATRELVLLEYDRFSQLIFRIEKICQSANEEVLPMNLRHTIIGLFIDEFDTIESVIECHQEIFTFEVIRFANLIHDYSRSFLFDRMLDVMNNKPDAVFIGLVELLTNYLQHVLVSMHEFNNNSIQKTESPFLCLEEFSVLDMDGYDRFLAIRRRAQFFSDSGVGSSYIFKNYTTADVVDDLKEILSNVGITLLPEPELNYQA